MADTSYDFEVSADPNFVTTALDSNDANHTASNCGKTNQLPYYGSRAFVSAQQPIIGAFRLIPMASAMGTL